MHLYHKKPKKEANMIPNVSILNSQNATTILHRNTETKFICRPRTETLECVVHHFTNYILYHNNKHETFYKICQIIRHYWNIDNICLQKGQTKMFGQTTNNNNNCNKYYFYDIYLDKNATLIFHNNENLSLIVYNNIVVNKNARVILKNSINIKCYGMLINRGKIIKNNQYMRCSMDTLENYHSIDVNSNIYIKFDVFDLILRKCFVKPNKHITKAIMFLSTHSKSQLAFEKFFQSIFNVKFYITKFYKVFNDVILHKKLMIALVKWMQMNTSNLNKYTFFCINILNYMTVTGKSHDFAIIMNMICDEQILKMIGTFNWTHYLAKILECCSAMIQKSSDIKSKVFPVFCKLYKINKNYNIFNKDIVLNADLFVQQYNDKYNLLLLAGFTKNVNIILPADIQQIVLLLHSPFNIKININMLDEFQNLLATSSIGTSDISSQIVECISNSFNCKNINIYLFDDAMLNSLAARISIAENHSKVRLGRFLTTCCSYFTMKYGTAICSLEFVTFMLKMSQIISRPKTLAFLLTTSMINNLKKCYISEADTNIRNKARECILNLIGNRGIAPSFSWIEIAIKACIEVLSNNDTANELIAVKGLHNIALANSHIDQKYFKPVLQALSVVNYHRDSNILSQLCQTYAALCQTYNNKYVAECIVNISTQHNKYDIYLLNGWLRSMTRECQIDFTQIPSCVTECCLEFSRMYSNILKFLLNDILEQSIKTGSNVDDSFSLIAIANMVQFSDENTVKIIADNGLPDVVLKLMKRNYKCDILVGILSRLTDIKHICIDKLLPNMIQPILILLLDTELPKKSVIINCLGNIANLSCVKYRDMLLESNLMNYLPPIFSIGEKKRRHLMDGSVVYNLLESFSWLLTNLCNKGKFDDRYLAPIIKLLNVLFHQIDDTDSDMLHDICYVYSYLTEEFDVNTLINYNQLFENYNYDQKVLKICGYMRLMYESKITIPMDIVNEIIKIGFTRGNVNNKMETNNDDWVKNVINISNVRWSNDVICASLITIGNIVTSGIEPTKHMIDRGLLDKLSNLLHSLDEVIVSETCYILSCVCSYSADLIEKVIDKNIFSQLIKLLDGNNCLMKITKEAFYCISNIIKTVSNTYIISNFVVDRVMISQIFGFISHIDTITQTIKADRDEEFVITALETVVRMILLAEQNQSKIYNIATYMKENDGSSLLNIIKYEYKNYHEIQQKVQYILDKCVK